MALLTFDQISMEFQDGRAEKMCVFVLMNLNGYFKVVKRAVALSATDIHAGTIATINGTIITIPAGPTADAIWVMVIGVAA
jgi:hypothetical protein